MDGREGHMGHSLEAFPSLFTYRASDDFLWIFSIGRILRAASVHFFCFFFANLVHVRNGAVALDARAAFDDF